MTLARMKVQDSGKGKRARGMLTLARFLFVLGTSKATLSAILTFTIGRLVAMANRIKLSGQTIKRLRNDRASCQDIREDFERAMTAGVPNMEELIGKLDIITDRIDKLLALNEEQTP